MGERQKAVKETKIGHCYGGELGECWALNLVSVAVYLKANQRSYIHLQTLVKGRILKVLHKYFVELDPI